MWHSVKLFLVLLEIAFIKLQHYVCGNLTCPQKTWVIFLLNQVIVFKYRKKIYLIFLLFLMTATDMEPLHLIYIINSLFFSYCV